MTDNPQCGRTFPHLPHETTAGDCPGLASDRINAAEDPADTRPLEALMEDTLRTGFHLPPRRQYGQDTIDHWALRPSYADLVTGLTTLAGRGCQNFETGSLGLCPHNGLVQRLWCPPCTAYITLNPARRAEPQEDPRG